MQESVRAEIAAIARDNESGASVLLQRGLDALARAAADGRDAACEAALALCEAQPSMAGFRTAADVVIGAAEPAAAIERLVQRTRRAPLAIARHTADLLALRREVGPTRIVTCSRSGTVEAAILRVAESRDVAVACSEGRPAYEGRQLAQTLAQRGVAVELFSDAAIGVALDRAEALLVGADAIGGSAFLNKVGTAALAALAGIKGVPTYVLAGMEKVVTPAVFDVLPKRSGTPDEVWGMAPDLVRVRNPYFEAVPLALATLVVTEVGALPIDMIVKHSYNMLDKR